jgi:hypothetical protein
VCCIEYLELREDCIGGGLVGGWWSKKGVALYSLSAALLHRVFKCLIISHGSQHPRDRKFELLLYTRFPLHC